MAARDVTARDMIEEECTTAFELGSTRPSTALSEGASPFRKNPNQMNTADPGPHKGIRTRSLAAPERHTFRLHASAAPFTQLTRLLIPRLVLGPLPPQLFLGWAALPTDGSSSWSCAGVQGRELRRGVRRRPPSPPVGRRARWPRMQLSKRSCERSPSRGSAPGS